MVSGVFFRDKVNIGCFFRKEGSLQRCSPGIGYGAGGLLFKGSGFYITDYRSSEYRAKARREAAGGTASSSGSESGDKKGGEKSSPSSGDAGKKGGE